MKSDRSLLMNISCCIYVCVYVLNEREIVNLHCTIV